MIDIIKLIKKQNDLYFIISEPLPGRFKMMVSGLAYKLQERDKKGK